MTHVVVVGNSIESAIKAFKRQVDRDGILARVRLRLKADPKPSVRRKTKARMALKRRARAAKRRYEPGGLR